MPAFQQVALAVLKSHTVSVNVGRRKVTGLVWSVRILGKRWSGRAPFRDVTMRQEETHAVCVEGKREASMDHVCIIGIDISRKSFQLHGGTCDGTWLLFGKLSRGRVLELFTS